MGGFKLYQDRVPGVCDGCAHVSVQRTTSQRVIARCNAQMRVPVITEPLEFCAMRVPRELDLRDLPKWYKETAWVGIITANHKRFVPPLDIDDDPEDMYVKTIRGYVVVKKRKTVGIKAEKHND